MVSGPGGAIKTRPKLLDFGIAHFVGLRGEKRITGEMFLGTQKYAAPEQIRGERPTAKTDLYSMGLVLYECVCGRGPFDDLGYAAAIAEAHLNKEPPRLSCFARVPDDLEDVIMSMLAKDPEKRPMSAAWLAVVLREIRERIGAQHGVTDASSLNDTEPTPIENKLITLSVALSDGGRGEITSPDAPRVLRTAGLQVGPHGTVPDRPMGNARTLVPGSAEASTPRGQPEIDRAAPTPTMKPAAAIKPTHGTEPIEGSKPSQTISAGDVPEKVYMPIEAFLPELAASPVPAWQSPLPAHGCRPQPRASSSAAVAMSTCQPARHAKWTQPRVALGLALGIGSGLLVVGILRSASHRAANQAQAAPPPPVATNVSWAMAPAAPAPVARTVAVTTASAPTASPAFSPTLRPLARPSPRRPPTGSASASPSADRPGPGF
jgi:serine/threonine-protein kinase